LHIEKLLEILNTLAVDEDQDALSHTVKPNPDQALSLQQWVL
jgi:hypothetical protein